MLRLAGSALPKCEAIVKFAGTRQEQEATAPVMKLAKSRGLQHARGACCCTLGSVPMMTTAATTPTAMPTSSPVLLPPPLGAVAFTTIPVVVYTVLFAITAPFGRCRAITQSRLGNIFHCHAHACSAMDAHRLRMPSLAFAVGRNGPNPMPCGDQNAP